MSTTETTTTRTIRKTVWPGTIPRPGFPHVRDSVHVWIQYEDGRLSLTGVIGAKANGDAHGSAGQIGMGFEHRNPAHNDRRYSTPTPAHDFEFAHGWDADTWLRLLDVWKRYHLNDMSPACEHQRAAGWTEQASEERTIYFWRLNSEAGTVVRDALKEAEKRLRLGETVTLPDAVAAIARLAPEVTTPIDASPGPLYEANAPKYENDTYNKPSETKTRGWLRPDEHPDGLLTKPCPDCGYRYGTEWRREEVPADVLDFLAALPSGGKACPWSPPWGHGKQETNS